MTENEAPTPKSAFWHCTRCVPEGSERRRRGVEKVCPATLQRDAGRVEIDRNPLPPPPDELLLDELEVMRGVGVLLDELELVDRLERDERDDRDVVELLCTGCVCTAIGC